MQKKDAVAHDAVIERCLVSFVQAGTLDLSLDQLARSVGVSKRMLIHYFGGRETIEERAMSLLEDRLRAQFSPDRMPKGASFPVVLDLLWALSTAPESRGILLLTMDLSRRAWNGSERAQRFYAEQQRLWVELLLQFTDDRICIEQVLQLFQGALFSYLITGNAERGRLAIRSLSRWMMYAAVRR
jgi:AcrR family transcriptional regulator